VWHFERERAVGAEICLDPLDRNSRRALSCDASSSRGGYLIGLNHRCALELIAQEIDNFFYGVKQ